MERKRKRRSCLFVCILFGAGILVGGAAVGIIEGNRGAQTGYLMQSQDGVFTGQDFVPFDKILKLDGYKKAKADNVEFCYEKKKPEIRITADMEKMLIQKNEYTFSASEAVVYDGELYVPREEMEQLLGMNISGDEKSGYSLEEQSVKAHAWTSSEVPLIAHAAGGFLEQQADGQRVQHTYTNAREPFVESYNKGFRVIEMDFQMSKDGVLCALHGWKDFGGKMNSDEFAKVKVDGQYTTMTMEDVLRGLSVNRDLYLVTDMKSYKWSDKKVKKRYREIYDMAVEYGGEQLADRIIPQIYEQSEYDIIKEVYNWSSIIYTLYKAGEVTNEEVVSFVEEKDDIPVVTVPQGRVSLEFSELLHDAGKMVYTHTINDTDNLYEWMNKGVDGFYTDTMTPSGYLARYGS